MRWRNQKKKKEGSKNDGDKLFVLRSYILSKLNFK